MARIPATEADTTDVQRRLRRMPFAGEMMAPHVRAVEADPLPPVNARGGRDVEGWTAVYEATVQDGEDSGTLRGVADDRLDQRHGRAAWCRVVFPC